MPYELSVAGSPGDELRRCLRERIDEAIEQLEDGHSDDPVEAVHDARKNMKRSRSLLRLARPALGGSAYRRENRALRDIARSVADVRDADAMIETVDALAKRFSGRLAKPPVWDLRTGLAKDGRTVGDPPIDDAIDALRAAAERADELPVDSAGWGDVRRGALRAYSRGRDLLAVAADDPTAHNLHEWRKRVKDLWYHQQLLGEAWPKLLKAHAKETHSLADLLGDDHDLAVLAERLEDSDRPPVHGHVDLDELLAMIAERRNELQSQAFVLGRRVYAERPKAYGRRLRAYLKAARREEQAAAA